MKIQIIESKNKKQKPKNMNIEFGSVFTDHMFIMDYKPGKGWINPRIQEYTNLEISPAALVFHYGQSMFEGMKAYKTKEGTINLFRPKKNIERANNSNRRLCIPEIPEDDFLQAIIELVKLDRAWIPEEKGSSLYIRPFIIASEESLNVRPSRQFKFVIILSPVGSYYKDGLKPVKIWVEDEYVRAVRGGIGAAKTGGNYAAAMLSQKKAHNAGYSQVLWLDALEHKYVEEVGAMNIFFKIDGKIITPSLNGSILAGVTRSSVIDLCKSFGINVEERKISIDEIQDAIRKGKLEETFGSGTAAAISPIGTFKFENDIYEINNSKIGELSQKIYDTLTDIQTGKARDQFNWITEII